MNYHDVMETYNILHQSNIFLRIVFLVDSVCIVIWYSKTAYAYDAEPVIWVQVPQWTDDWAVCAVDIPDAACHWYVANADNTFGEGFDWENAPWFDANGLNDVAPMQASTVVEKLQDIG